MKSPRHFRTATGWTLVEVLVVVGVMSLVAAALTGAMQGLAARHHAKQAAAEFQAMVREAGALARREMAPVRIVFLLPECADALEQAGVVGEGSRPLPGCRLLLFSVPGRHLPVRSLQSPRAGVLPELPVSRVPRFEPMAGGWTGAPNRRAWLRWSDVEVGGDLVECYRSEGFQAVAERFLFQPETMWAERDGGKKSPFSIYPEEFSHSPYRDLRSVVMEPLPADAAVRVEGGGWVTAEQAFGGEEVPRWSDRSSESRADRVALPAIDFMPDGGLACREEVEEVRFRFGDKGKASHWIVRVRTADGEVWLE